MATALEDSRSLPFYGVKGQTEHSLLTDNRLLFRVHDAHSPSVSEKGFVARIYTSKSSDRGFLEEKRRLLISEHWCHSQVITDRVDNFDFPTSQVISTTLNFAYA